MKLRDPWIEIDDEDECLELPRLNAEIFWLEDPAENLAAELERELCDNHPLKGYKFEVVAKSKDTPHEFIFRTNNPKYK